MESAKPAAPLDRRRQMRQRALLAGKLSTPDAAATLDCTIRNFSPDGAMIELHAQTYVPRELHLVQITEGVAWDAEVIWRKGNKIGLALKDRHDLKEPVGKQLRALRAVWSQMALR